jgi:hypothetical protein
MLDAIFPIVEGHGDLFAVLELLRRLAIHRSFSGLRPALLSAVVLANREYESWFLASAIALRGRMQSATMRCPQPTLKPFATPKGIWNSGYLGTERNIAKP